MNAQLAPERIYRTRILALTKEEAELGTGDGTLTDGAVDLEGVVTACACLKNDEHTVLGMRDEDLTIGEPLGTFLDVWVAYRRAADANPFTRPN